MSGSRARSPRTLCAAALCALVGCASSDASGTWLLPEHAPAKERAPARAEAIAALGTATVAALGSQWTEGSLTLGHVLTSVEETYPLLSAARQELVIAEADQLAALGAYDLKLGADASWAATGFYEHNTARGKLEQLTGVWGLKLYGGYRLGAGDFDPTFDGKRVTNHGGEVFAGARLPLLRDGSIDSARRDLRASALEREIAGNELATRRLRFEREATLAYWRWVAAGRQRRVAQSLLALAETRQEGIVARIRRGALSEIEATDNERLVVRRRALVIGARRALERASIALSLFLRDPQGRPQRPPSQALPGDFPPPAAPAPGGLEQDVLSALRQRPDLGQIARERGRAALDLDYAENQALPQLDVFVSGSQDGDRTRPSRTKGEFELNAGLEFSFPVQNREARGKARAARAKIEALREKERYLRDRVTAEVHDAFSALRAAYQTFDQAQRAASLASRVGDAERRRFDLGVSDVLRLNLREEATAEAQLGVIKALLEYWSATASYRAAVGAPALP